MFVFLLTIIGYCVLYSNEIHVVNVIIFLGCIRDCAIFHIFVIVIVKYELWQTFLSPFSLAREKKLQK